MKGEKMKLIAIDQYRHAYPIERHPRKELLELFGREHAERMYRDTPGKTRHVGYIIAGRWLEIFKVTSVA